MMFLPLAVWAVGFLFVWAYTERTFYMIGYTKNEVKAEHKGIELIWVLGCIFFFVIGVV